MAKKKLISVVFTLNTSFKIEIHKSKKLSRMLNRFILHKLDRVLYFLLMAAIFYIEPLI